ncbi:MAG: TPM domain-containing protein [Chthoniobacteraceae bacterium]
MHHKEFLDKIDDAKVVAAIAEAERRTSGEIRIWVSHRKISDALGTAQKRFLKLGMDKTPERNAVMLYIAPRSQVFAVVGDSGVHEKCGDAFWTEVTSQLSADLKKESITAALVNAVGKVGDLLAAHFPPGAGGGDKLPNDILRD